MRRRPEPRPPARRAYESPLRAAQRDATRRAIAEAARALLEEPGSELTVPAIAARAGVSVPTVNRHFPSRQALLEGVVAHLDSLAEQTPLPARVDPASFFGEGRAAMVRELFARFSVLTPPAGAGAALMELRSRVTIPRRRRLVDDGIAAALPTLPEPQRTWLSDLIVVLLSSAMVQTMKSYLGHTPAENAARMEWLLDALVTDAGRLAQTARVTPSRRKATRGGKASERVRNPRGGRT